MSIQLSMQVSEEPSFSGLLSGNTMMNVDKSEFHIHIILNNGNNFMYSIKSNFTREHA